MTEQKEREGMKRKSIKDLGESSQKMGIKVVKLLRQLLFHTHSVSVDSIINS